MLRNSDLFIKENQDQLLSLPNRLHKTLYPVLGVNHFRDSNQSCMELNSFFTPNIGRGHSSTFRYVIQIYFKVNVTSQKKKKEKREG